MSLSLRSCTRLTRWWRLRPRRSSLQTTITSPCRAALRKAASPGRSLFPSMENPHFVREGLRLRPVYQDRWLQAYSLAPPCELGSI